jgi:hypothetical protein
MFRAILAHPQEALNKRHLVHCVRVMSAGCTRTEVPLLFQFGIPMKLVWLTQLFLGSSYPFYF